MSGGGRKPLCNAMEESLYEWLKTMRNTNLRVSRKRLRQKAKEIYDQLVREGSTAAASFEASPGWLDNFMIRYKLSLRWVTTACQKTPADYIPKPVAFVTFVCKQRIIRQYPYGAILAADETVVWLDSAGNITVEIMGKKDVPI